MTGAAFYWVWSMAVNGQQLAGKRKWGVVGLFAAGILLDGFIIDLLRLGALMMGFRT